MKVTEHNLTDWELNVDEITELIRLVRLEMKDYETDRATQTYYGMILGKLMIMKGNK